MTRKISVALLAAAVLIAAVVVADRLPADAVRLVVHEWGTFTSLQDENGRTLPILFGDDEPLPDFVHEIDGGWCVGSDKQVPHVTMRLETPVIYFYPAASQDVWRLDVEVDFPGGWLNQFYPEAEAEAPGIEEGVLTSQTFGRLAWRGLSIGGRADRQWLHLRKLTVLDGRA